MAFVDLPIDRHDCPFKWQLNGFAEYRHNNVVDEVSIEQVTITDPALAGVYGNAVRTSN